MLIMHTPFSTIFRNSEVTPQDPSNWGGSGFILETEKWKQNGRGGRKGKEKGHGRKGREGREMSLTHPVKLS